MQYSRKELRVEHCFMQYSRKKLSWTLFHAIFKKGTQSWNIVSCNIQERNWVEHCFMQFSRKELRVEHCFMQYSRKELSWTLFHAIVKKGTQSWTINIAQEKTKWIGTENFPSVDLWKLMHQGMCNNMLELCLIGSIMGFIPTQVEDGLHLFITEMMQHTSKTAWYQTHPNWWWF